MLNIGTSVLGLCISLLPAVADAGAGVFRWIDETGQTHFSDKPPTGYATTMINLPPSPQGGESGLRAGERNQLGIIEQRQQKNRRRAQAARSKIDQQRRTRARQCKQQREKLKTARGRDNYKKHARFLRNHCW